MHRTRWYARVFFLRGHIGRADGLICPEGLAAREFFYNL